MNIEISKNVKYIGCSDTSADLFEGQYIIPDGMAYNSYLIIDEKTAAFDTVDRLVGDEYLANLEHELNGRKLDYLIIQHLEPDHSALIAKVTAIYPDAQLVMSAKAKAMLSYMVPGVDLQQRVKIVAENDTLSLGEHELHFIAAPMIHWPEVIMTYENSEQLFFAADAFGKFGAQGCEDDLNGDWACEARRYYFNIVGKYGRQVQNLLKKATFPIKKILPLHGPILTENLDYYINLYDTWSSYRAEVDGVFIAYASLHGHTADAANEMAEILKAKGCPKVAIADLSHDDIAECVEDSFKYGKVILAASSYDAGVMPKMEELLFHLKAKNYQNRRIGLIENTSFAPSAIRTMKAILEAFSGIEIIDPTVSIKVHLTDENRAHMNALAEAMLK